MSTGPSYWCPKHLREVLCTQQTYAPDIATSAAIGDLIRLLDIHRPLGSNGKHGTLHTTTCGCEDVDDPPTARELMRLTRQQEDRDDRDQNWDTAEWHKRCDQGSRAATAAPPLPPLADDRVAMILGLVPDKRTPAERLYDAVRTNGESLRFRYCDAVNEAGQQCGRTDEHDTHTHKLPCGCTATWVSTGRQ